MQADDICFLSAEELGRAIRSRTLSARETVEVLLERISRVNPALNAYITVCAERALEEARRADRRRRARAPLHGIPFSVKDLIFTAGVRTTSGSRIYESFVPSDDSRAVARLRAAGAILLGKTNTPEFGYKATTESPLFGATRNPWSLERTSGGSSGGAAAAASAGLSPLALGTDGGGSIRIPASFCGVFGLKPTFGLIPTMPGRAGWRSLSHTGPIARTVRDAALMLDVMAGPDEADRLSVPRDRSYRRAVDRRSKGLRIGYSLDLGFARVETEVAAVVEKAVGVFQELGHTVEQIRIDLGEAKKAFETTVLAENTAAHLAELETHRNVMDEGLVGFIERGIGMPAGDYLGAMRRRDGIAQRAASAFEAHDLIVTPTVAVPPFPIGSPPREIAGAPADPLDWIPFTYPFNLTGNPAASLPCGWTAAGLPVGLQIVGPRYRDGLVLDLSAQFEEARPWVGARPALPTRAV